MVKRFFALLSAVALALTLASCGKAEQPPQTSPSTETTTAFEAEGDIDLPATTQGIGNIRTTTTATNQTQPTQTASPKGDVGPLFQSMVRDRVRSGTYTIKFKQSGMSMITYVSGKDSVLESNASGLLQFTLINKDNRYYMLAPKTQRYVELSSQDYAQQADTFGSVSPELDDLVLTDSGAQTLEGKQYQTETYDEGSRGIVTYYFDDTGLRKARVDKDGQTTMIDLFEVTTGVDAAVFTVPADYTKVTDPGQLFA